MTEAMLAVSHSGHWNVSAIRKRPTMTRKVGVENTSSRRNGGPSRSAPPSFDRKKTNATVATTNVNAANTKNGSRQAPSPIPSDSPQAISSGVAMIPTVRPMDRPVITMPRPSVRWAAGVCVMIRVRSLE